MVLTADDLRPAKVLHYRSPVARQETTARIGMAIFLGSWCMLFAPLFFVYAGLRFRAPLWPPMDMPPLPLPLPALNTLVAAASSAAIVFAVRGIGRGQTGRLRWGLLGATVLGATFLALQTVVWVDLYGQGLWTTTGTYGSVFFGLTWVHAAHVVVGVVAFGVLTVRAFLGAYSPARYLTPRLWAMYWHFVGVVWAVLFVTVYVL